MNGHSEFLRPQATRSCRLPRTTDCPSPASGSVSRSARKATAVRDGPGPRRGFTAGPPAAPAAGGVARRRLRRARPAAPAAAAAAPVEGAGLPEVHEAGEQQRDEHGDLGVAGPAEPSGVDRPGEDEHGLQVEDHEEERDLVELHREPPGQRPRRPDAGLVGDRPVGRAAALAEQRGHDEDGGGEEHDEAGVEDRRPYRRSHQRTSHPTPRRSSSSQGPRHPGCDAPQTNMPRQARPDAHLMVDRSECQGERSGSGGARGGLAPCEARTAMAFAVFGGLGG